MFNDNEWNLLSSELLKLSTQGKLAWEEWLDGYATTVQDDRYAVGSKDKDDRPPYFLAAYKRGFIEEIGETDFFYLDSTETIPESNETTRERDQTTENILELYTLAGRISMGTPKLFSELIGNLQNLEDTTPPF